MPHFFPKANCPHWALPFTQISALAQQHQAINLSQGFPDFSGPNYLQQCLAYQVAQGANQYAPMTGAAPLRSAIAEKTAAQYGWQPDADNDITVTTGATEALFAAIAALVRPGDEVICFDPSYDSYAPAIELTHGVSRAVKLPYSSGDPQHATQSVCHRVASERFRAVVAGDCGPRNLRVER